MRNKKKINPIIKNTIVVVISQILIPIFIIIELFLSSTLENKLLMVILNIVIVVINVDLIIFIIFHFTKNIKKD